MVAGGDVAVTAGGGAAFVAGGDMTITQGGGQYLVAGGTMRIAQGGGAILVAGQASVERGIVGLLVSGKTTLNQGARVLLTTPQAAALGAALGLVFAMASRWFRRGPTPAP